MDHSSNVFLAMSDKLIYQQKDRNEITLDDLYPELTPEQRSEAEYRLLRYFGIVKGIFERIVQENPVVGQFEIRFL